LKCSRKTVSSPPRSVGLIAWALGETKDEAVGQVRAAVAERLAHGELLRVQIEDLPTAELADPWEAMAGRFADDPKWDEFQEELRRIREEANRV
jgi:hypothetical protein